MGFRWDERVYNMVIALRTVSNLFLGEKNMDELGCGICLDVVENQDARVSVLNCGHAFCTDCVSRCGVCPICRRDVYLESVCGDFYINKNGL